MDRWTHRPAGEREELVSMVTIVQLLLPQLTRVPDRFIRFSKHWKNILFADKLMERNRQSDDLDTN